MAEYKEPELPPYKVYQISSDGQLEVQSDQSNDELEHLRVINYSGLVVTEDKRVYGAVLELL